MIHHKTLRTASSDALGITKGPAERISHQVIGAALEVHRQLGPGLLENAYEVCLCQELSLREIEFQRQVAIPIEYHGAQVDCGYRLDLVVGNNVIVEVKSTAKVLPVHRAQLMTYLKLMKLHLGLIINFNVSNLPLGVYRIVI